MKRIIFGLLIFFVNISAFADEYVISKIECRDSEYFYNKSISFKYDDEENVYYLFRSDYSSSYLFTLTPEKLEQLRNNLSKTKEWVDLANANKTTISKELPDSEIKVEGTMKTGRNWYVTKKDIPLNFFFISSFSEEAEFTSLTIVGGESESKQNKYIDIEFENVVFINTAIDDFITAISKETVDKAKEKHANEKNASDLFN